MNKKEFIKKIRNRYPQYNNIKDDDLYSKIINKYPQYKDQITEEKPNQLEDIGKGALSGLSEIPRAAAHLSNSYLRPTLTGQKPLSEQDLNKAISVLGASEYRPQTTAGNIAKFAGGIAPYFLLPEAKLATAPKYIKNLIEGGKIGGISGLTSSLNHNQNPITGTATGALSGATLGAVLPEAGKVLGS